MYSYSKTSPEKKLQLVKQYLAGSFGLVKGARLGNVDQSTFRSWVSKYRSEGDAAFVHTDRRRQYPIELKLAAAKDIIDGNGSYYEICRKYNIRCKDVLHRWVKIYNSHGTFQTYSGGSCMTKSRKTTFEERVEIARFCLANSKNYGLAAQKFNVSYEQARRWTLRFCEMGEAGLEDRRGKPTLQQAPRNNEEELKAQIARLEHDLYMARMENDLLKKLDALERRDASRK